MKNIIIFLVFFIYSCAGVEYSRHNYSLYYYKYPDYTYAESAHFILNSPSPDYARIYLDLAEKYYYSVMMDTNLFSFVQTEPYRVIIHHDKKSFIDKTGSPEWSGGFVSSNTIETYVSSNTNCVLAHEITHLIMNEYLNIYSSMNRWLEEGLATYEERKACFEVDNEYTDIFKSKVIPSPYPFSVMIDMNLEKTDTNDNVKKFYAQSSDIVKFMIEKEGPFKFYIFLDSIKKGFILDDALKNAYPQSFSSIYDLERLWIKDRIVK